MSSCARGISWLTGPGSTADEVSPRLDVSGSATADASERLRTSWLLATPRPVNRAWLRSAAPFLLALAGCSASVGPNPFVNDSSFTSYLVDSPGFQINGVIEVAGRVDLRAWFFVDEALALDGEVTVTKVSTTSNSVVDLGRTATDYEYRAAALPPGFYSPGSAYRFEGRLVSRPQRYSAIQRSPDLGIGVEINPMDKTPSSTFPGVMKHQISSDLRLEFPSTLGDTGYVTIYRASTSSTVPQVVYDEPPHENDLHIQNLVGRKPGKNLTVPGSVLSVPGVYLVLLTALRSDIEEERLGTSWAVVVGKAHGFFLDVGGL